MSGTIQRLQNRLQTQFYNLSQVHVPGYIDVFETDHQGFKLPLFRISPRSDNLRVTVWEAFSNGTYQGGTLPLKTSLYKNVATPAGLKLTVKSVKLREQNSLTVEIEVSHRDGGPSPERNYILLLQLYQQEKEAIKDFLKG